MAEPTVNLAEFGRAARAIRDEFARLPTYEAAAEFWKSYNANLTGSYEELAAIRADMETNAEWDNSGNPSASTAFYERLDAGMASIRRWQLGGTEVLDGASTWNDYGTGALAAQFDSLFQEFPDIISKLDASEASLLAQFKLTKNVSANAPGISTLPQQPIVAEDLDDRPENASVVVPAGNEIAINNEINEANRLRDQLRGHFERIKFLLNTLPENVPWEGPAELTGGPPGGPAGPGGGPAPGAPGGPGGGPAAADAADAMDAAAPGGPAEAGGPPGASAEPPSTPDVGTPGATLPGESPGDTVPTGDPATADPTTVDPGTTSLPPTSLPPTDPSLAGVPTATSPASLPGGTTSPLPGTVPGVPTGSGSGSSPVLPLNPAGTAPLPTPFSSTPRPGGEPLPANPRGSTVDGVRGGTPGAAPVPRGALGSSGSGSGSGFGPGFYPPMVPPMYPGSGGGNSGIKPGEADFAGGPIRQVGGRESWRAGLRPQLLGRAGDHDDEPDHLPPERPRPADDVLDEELWQVPGAAPVSPPEPPSRRGRAWGPG